MSLKDLLLQGTFDEITEGLPKETQTIECRCPQCGKVMVYDVKILLDPFALKNASF